MQGEMRGSLRGQMSLSPPDGSAAAVERVVTRAPGGTRAARLRAARMRVGTVVRRLRDMGLIVVRQVEVGLDVARSRGAGSRGCAPGVFGARGAPAGALIAFGVVTAAELAVRAAMASMAPTASMDSMDSMASTASMAPTESVAADATRRRTDSGIVEALGLATGEAVLAICAAAEDGSIAPVIAIPVDLEHAELLSTLVTPLPSLPRGRWTALRIGRGVGGGGSGAAAGGARGIAQPFDAASAHGAGFLAHAEDLDRAAALVVRHAFLQGLIAAREESASDGLGPLAALASSTIRGIVESLPPPPRHPGADPRFRREVQSASRAATGARVRERALQLEGDHREALAAARGWLARLDAVYAAIHSIADAEGRAIVRVHRAVRLIESGWDPEVASTMDARPLGEDGVAPATGVVQPIDRVLREIRDARARGYPCDELAETLAVLRPIGVEVAEVVHLDADGRLQASERSVRLTAERLEGWRRACGMRDGIREAPRAAPSPSRRKRDAPFGIKPLGLLRATGWRDPGWIAARAEASGFMPARRRVDAASADGGGVRRAHDHPAIISRQRRSQHPSACSRRFRYDSSASSSASAGTRNGSPITAATRAPSFGICDLSQCRSVQYRSASRWNGRIGWPLARASQVAPGCATRFGPRGPSTVSATGVLWTSRSIWSMARRAPRELEPRMVRYPNCTRSREIHSPSKLSLAIAATFRPRK